MLKALFYPNVNFESLCIPHIYREIYLDRVYKDIFINQKDMIVIDVGANIGIVTQYMRDFAQKVYAIEPATDNFEALLKNKEFNNWDNVELFKLAISDKNGEADLHLFNTNRTGHSLTNTWEGLIKEPATEKVKTITIDTFFTENKIELVDFIKFDVEGAEDLILRSEGFKKVVDKIKAIEIEFHKQNWLDLLNYLISFGFKTKRCDCSYNVFLFRK